MEYCQYLGSAHCYFALTVRSSLILVHLGAQPVATVHTTVPAKAYGMVNNLSIRQFGSKKMLHLHPPGESAICTMILCHRNETMLSELKVSKV